LANPKKFRSLTTKMMIILFVAAVLALLVGMGGRTVGLLAVDQFYMSEEAAARRMIREANSFREYVADNNLSSTDVAGVELWNREHRYTQLTVKGLSTTISSNAVTTELMGTESGIVVQSGQSTGGGLEFSVNFKDGAFPVVIFESSESLLKTLVNVGAVIVGAVAFLTTVLLYDRNLTRSIQMLSSQVMQVSRGDLDMQILPMTQDEVGTLAMDVDTMRLSIIDKLQKEEAAWQANSQLITAISHDVRTPLTALMGYLEILGDESLNTEEKQSYLQICKNNAQRLKELTDELFGFFLVFGKPKPDQNPELYDAATLLDQILLEHQVRLSQERFDLRFVHQGELTGKIYVDIGHLRRVFDNLFSNVMKYADPEEPVVILQSAEEDILRITISNHVSKTARQVESNKIGLQTCKKLVESMGGEFSQNCIRNEFCVEAVFPLHRS